MHPLYPHPCARMKRQVRESTDAVEMLKRQQSTIFTSATCRCSTIRLRRYLRSNDAVLSFTSARIASTLVLSVLRASTGAPAPPRGSYKAVEQTNSLLSSCPSWRSKPPTILDRLVFCRNTCSVKDETFPTAYQTTTVHFHASRLVTRENLNALYKAETQKYNRICLACIKPSQSCANSCFIR